jgi:hypothetical protein
MSFRAPHRSRSPNKTSRSDARVAAYQLVPTEDVGSQRKPWGTVPLTRLPRRDAYGPAGPRAQAMVPMTDDVGEIDDAFMMTGGTELFATPRAVDAAQSSHGRKKERQWQRWTVDIIPSLVPVLLSLLCVTDSFRNDIPPSSVLTCDCPSNTRHLDVAAIYFDREYCNTCWHVLY